MTAVVDYYYAVIPGALTNMGKQISWSEVAEHDSIEGLREWFRSGVVERIMRGGLGVWLKWLLDSPKIKVSELVDIDPVREVFQRRHLLVHTGGVVSRPYLGKVSGISQLPKLGERLEVDADYVAHAADLLTEMALGLVRALVLTLPSDDDEVDAMDAVVANTAFRLLKQERYQLVVRLAERYPPPASAYGADALVINRWLALRATGRGAEITGEVTEWASTVTDSHELGVRLLAAALTGDLERASDLMREYTESTVVGWMTLVDWPVFAELRAYMRDHPVRGARRRAVPARPNNTGPAVRPRRR